MIFVRPEYIVGTEEAWKQEDHFSIAARVFETAVPVKH